MDTHLPGVYHHGKSCNQCLKTDKKLKVLLGANHTTKVPKFLYENEELNLDIA